MASYAPGTVRSFGRPEDHFTIVSNTFLRMKLSLRAFRVAAYVLSHSADFHLTQHGIAGACDMARSTVVEALKDLEKAGLLIRLKQQDERGHRVADQLLISQQPFTAEQRDSLCPESGRRESLSRESGQPKKSNSKKKINPEEEHSSSSADALDPEPALFEDPSPQKRKDPKAQAHAAMEAFGEFWLTWPRKVGKTAAEKAFVKAFLLKDAPTAEKLQAAALALAVRYAKAAPDRRQFMPHAATWLNRHGWHEAAEDTFPDLGSAGSGVSDLQKNGSDWHALGGADPKEVDWVARREALIEKPMVEAPQPPPGWKPPVPGRLGFP